MSNHTSPFAALTGAEKQIRWLEYQSIRLPYVQGNMDENLQKAADTDEKEPLQSTAKAAAVSLPQPPPEIPRTMPDMQRTRHSQYDAVIARLKQAELQSRRLQTSEQG